MKTFEQWFKENYDEELPDGSLNGAWFTEHGLPMIVECTCCTTSMTLPSALIDGDNHVYCSSCGGNY